MVWRVSMIPWKLLLCICLLLGIMPTIGMLVVVIASVACSWGFIGFLVKCLCGSIYNGDPDYRKFRANGGHPYWSLLPPPINTDSLAVRAGRIRRARTDFVPPSEWLIQCPKCGARNEDYGPVGIAAKASSGRSAIPRLR